MKSQLSHYAAYSRQQLQPDFQRAGVSYPPKQLALLVFKQSKKLQLYVKEKGRWHFIKNYSILAESGGPGPKLHQGDRQVPEGVYRITALNPESHYLMSMKLNYPNQFDRKEAKESNRSHLGNNIFIHGKALSIGCIAVGDKGIEELFPLVAAVGFNNIEVVIAPDDFRFKKPVYGKIRPNWLPTLYQRIRVALKNFPLPGRM